MNAPVQLWRNRSFTLLFSAHVISLLGSGATTIGLALFAYRMAGAGSATVVVGPRADAAHRGVPARFPTGRSSC